MTPLIKALRAKYSSPQEAMLALGLDVSLLASDTNNTREQKSAGKQATDSKSTKEATMAKILLTRKAALVQGALMNHLAPLLAQDARIDLTPMLKGVTHKNFKARRAGLLANLTKATEGKLAEDADIADVTKLLDALEDVAPAEDMEPSAGTPVLGKKAMDEEEDDEDKKKAEDESEEDEEDDEDKKKAEDESEEDEDDKPAFLRDKDKRGAKDKRAKDEEPKKDMVDKKAMDAAIIAAVKSAREQERAVHAAEDKVRPRVGRLAMACDSAPQVFKAALEMIGVPVAGIHPSAYEALFDAHTRNSGEAAPKPRMATDAKQINSFYELFPEAKGAPAKAA